MHMVAKRDYGHSRPDFRNALGIRCLDLLGAGVGLVALSPALMTLTVLIRLDSPGPALHRAVRIGREGRPFTLYKFRSMVERASSLGPEITVASDSRITKTGSTIRSWKLDELPQLLNVLKGDMSLVGPRPEDPKYVSLYSRDQLSILQAKPGITSPASLLFREESATLTGDEWQHRYIHEVMPAKLAADSEYIARRTVWSDVGVIFQTVWVLVSRGWNRDNDRTAEHRQGEA